MGLIGQLDGVVLEDWTEIESVPLLAKYVGSGLDFGYTNDPSCLIDVYQYNREYIFDEVFYQTGLSNKAIADLSKSFERPPIVKGDPPRIVKRSIYADSAEPKSIAEIYYHGINIYPATKGADSIKYGLQLLQENPFRVTARSNNVKKDLDNYLWAKDKDGNSLNVPIVIYKHSPDAMRYWAIENIGVSRKVDIR